MMNFCNWLFVVLLFLFATFKLFLRHSFNTFFFAKKQDRKQPFQAEYVTRKLKWKFAIRDSWFVTILVREPCPPPPECPTGVFSLYVITCFYFSWIVNSIELFFVFRDQMVVRAPRKTRINNRYSWSYFLFFPDFQFQDFRKINKENVERKLINKENCFDSCNVIR